MLLRIGHIHVALTSKFFNLDIPAHEDLSSFQVGEPKNHRKDIRPVIGCEKEFIL